MSEIGKKDDEKLNTSNIFDEFEVDEKTKKDINELEKSINKDLPYYLEKIWSGVRLINYVLFILILIFVSYIILQRSTADFLNNKEYLSPFCNILNGTIEDVELCSSLAISTSKVEEDISNLQEGYMKKVASILQKTYEIDNVKNSKESIFIIDKNKNKNDPYIILNEFDKIKNEFTSIDKKKIQCKDIVIEGKIFEAKCSAFSTLWYDNIPWLKWEKTNTISWTSITLASSFINYISNIPNIRLLEKQKTFYSQTYFWEWNYTYKTDFKIKFEYNSTDLSL